MTKRKHYIVNETLQMTMLFDFFGDLLTERQREYFDLYHNEDLSLSEIAEGTGISKQGVYDIITRAEKTLMEIEQKTGIIKKWRETRAGLDRLSLTALWFHRSRLVTFKWKRKVRWRSKAYPKN